MVVVKRAMFNANKYKNKETKQCVQDVLDTFETFGIPMELVEVVEGMHELRIYLRTKKPSRMSEIEKFQKDLAYALGNTDVAIQAPVPDKKLIGVCIPVDTKEATHLHDTAAESDAYNAAHGSIIIPLGVSELGEPIIEDITAWPHALIAGSTGSGKSNCLHNIIVSLARRYTPDELRLLLIDPKNFEFAPYQHLSHLLVPPLGDNRKGILALKWLSKEMQRRYDVLRIAQVRDIAEYKQTCAEEGEPMPYIVTVIDELASGMEQYPKEYEAALVRLLQTSRAVGIHLIIATQQPSGKCVTGLLRTNIPTRMSFRVASMVDSRTILDQSGAEKLRGHGDALLLRANERRPLRTQTPLVTPEIMHDVARTVEEQYGTMADMVLDEPPARNLLHDKIDNNDELDDLYTEIRAFILQQQKVSTSLIQRRFKVGYGRSARIIDQLAEQGVIEADKNPGKPWKVVQREVNN